MVAAIFCVPCCRISLGIISNPSNDSNFMSSILFRRDREEMVSWGQEREEMVNHSLKVSSGEWVLCHIGNNSVKKGKHPIRGDLQVSQSIQGEKVRERKVCDIRARGR